MARKKSEPAPTVLTPHRAARLYRLLCLTAESSRTRKFLLTKLKVDLRGFYRDLEFLRTLGIEINFTGDKYQLTGSLDDALAILPFPDPGLSIRDAVQLARGNADANRKIRRRLDALVGTTQPSAPAAE